MKKAIKATIFIFFGLILSINAFSCQCNGEEPSDFDDVCAICFYSDDDFQLDLNGNGGWDGKIEWATSYGGNNWQEWEKDNIEPLNAEIAEDGENHAGQYVLYLRGTDNTRITRAKLNEYNSCFIINSDSNSGVYCEGSMRYLMDYTKRLKDIKMQTTLNEETPFGCMFLDCEKLLSAPDLPFTELTQGCYKSMFFGCSNLKIAPALPAKKLASQCYEDMFNGCHSLTRIPSIGHVTDVEGAQWACRRMFFNCSYDGASGGGSTTTAGVVFSYGDLTIGCPNRYSIPYIQGAPDAISNEMLGSGVSPSFDMKDNPWCANVEVIDADGFIHTDDYSQLNN